MGKQVSLVPGLSGVLFKYCPLHFSALSRFIYMRELWTAWTS